MYNYGYPNYYRCPYCNSTQYYNDNRNYYNQNKFNNLPVNPMYGHQFPQFDMYEIHEIRQQTGQQVGYQAGQQWPTRQTNKGDRLRPGERLLPGESLTSPNGQYLFIMQGDGNLVLYRSNKALWHSHTHGKKADYAILQDDGNFVIYGEGKALWHSHTHGKKADYAILQDDGNFVIYGEGKALWHTHTHGNTGTAGGEEDCTVTGGRGKRLDSGTVGLRVLDLEYIIYECAIEVKPKIAGINTGGTYTLSATNRGVSAIWPIIAEVSRYVFSVYVENKTLWVELEMQHRTAKGFPPKFVWRKTWGAKTKVGSSAGLKF